jgi:hypothetical protein
VSYDQKHQLRLEISPIHPIFIFERLFIIEVNPSVERTIQSRSFFTVEMTASKVFFNPMGLVPSTPSFSIGFFSETGVMVEYNYN